MEIKSESFIAACSTHATINHRVWKREALTRERKIRWERERKSLNVFSLTRLIYEEPLVNHFVPTTWHIIIIFLLLLLSSSLSPISSLLDPGHEKDQWKEAGWKAMKKGGGYKERNLWKREERKENVMSRCEEEGRRMKSELRVT